MKSIDLIRTALAIGDQGMLTLVDDMRDAPMTAPTPRGGNHPLWVLGHVAFVEAGLSSILFGEPHPFARWAPLFAPGSTPKSDAGAYPSFDEIRRVYVDARKRNLEILDRLGAEALDRPTVAPLKGLEAVMRTAGETFLLMALHQMNHRGQVADARRAAGREPLFTPGIPG